MKKFEINDRIIDLMKSRGYDEVFLAKSIGKNPSTIYRITAKDTVPSKTTVKLISEALSVDFLFLLTGKMQQNATIQEKENPWKDEAYVTLKNEVSYLKQKYDQLMDAILTGKLGKHKTSAYAGLFKMDNQTEVYAKR